MIPFSMIPSHLVFHRVETCVDPRHKFLFVSCFIILSILSVANVRGCEGVFLLCLSPLLMSWIVIVCSFFFQNNFTTIKEFLKMIIDALREEINQLKGDNDELRRSLEFTQAELTEMRKTCAILNGEKQVNAVSYPEKRELLERVQNLEDYSRRNNLIVEGLQEESDENNEVLQTSMEKLLKEKLDFTPKIDVVHRMGKQLDNNPRYVIFRLRTFRERQECLKLLPKLKGTNIYINEDISKSLWKLGKLN